MGVEVDIDRRELRRERSVEMRDQDDNSPTRERWEGGYDDLDEDDAEKLRESSKHRSKERSGGSSRREEKDHRSKERERTKTSESMKEGDKESSRDRRKEDRDEREKDKSRDKVREKDADRDKYKDKERDKDRKDRGKEKEREREKERELEKDGERRREKEKAKEKSKEKDRDREKERDRMKEKEREREKDREKHRDREKERDNEKDRIRDASEREKGKERVREKELEVDTDREKLRERDRGSRKQREEDHDRAKDDKTSLDNKDAFDSDIIKRRKGSYDDEDERKTPKFQQSTGSGVAGAQHSVSELEERILKMKEERLQKKSEGASEVLAWVNQSRKLEERMKNEKEKALQLSKAFEEQDNINQEESDNEVLTEQTARNLGGVKILHGLDKVLEGGAVVLTLKDQSILADGDINQDVDMLENVEIGEQKRRDEAYSAAKKKTGTYDDKFNEEPGSEKKILPQYDEPAADEGITLDASGRFTGDAEKKLEELRKRIRGVSTSNHVEDLNSSGKILSDYYTQEEMLQFKKPRKKKSLRKKEKLDLDVLEAEAIAAGLGSGDLGSRRDGKRQTLKEEEARAEAEMRSNAFQAAYAKAEEASRALRLQRTSTIPTEEDDTLVGDDDEDLRKSLERARKLALRKQEEAAASGPEVIARLASSTANKSPADSQDSAPGETQENKVVFTEMEEFVWGLQLNEEAQKHDGEDVFMEEDETPVPSDQGNKEDDGGWTEIKEKEKEETPALEEEEEEVVPDETIHEAAVGKGLASALKLLKDRGSLKETVEWGGRNMDKKKSKLVGIYDDDGQKEIHIERTDEYGRILTPKEAFRLISHKFHGKGPGKMKQEKRMRQYQEELKVKQMKNADTPSQSVERMREVQAQLKTPYLVLSGHVKPGQTSDPRSGFATVEKDLPGGLTPMLGDKKVEHFLGLKRKAESGDAASQKKPKT